MRNTAINIRTHHFLDLDLLERAEAARSRLHMQCAVNAILLAFRFILAVEDGLEVFSGYVLEGFGAADIACIRVHSKERLNF